jgi:hypothetical protein
MLSKVIREVVLARELLEDDGDEERHDDVHADQRHQHEVQQRRHAAARRLVRRCAPIGCTTWRRRQQSTHTGTTTPPRTLHHEWPVISGKDLKHRQRRLKTPRAQHAIHAHEQGHCNVRGYTQCGGSCRATPSHPGQVICGSHRQHASASAAVAAQCEADGKGPSRHVHQRTEVVVWSRVQVLHRAREDCTTTPRITNECEWLQQRCIDVGGDCNRWTARGADDTQRRTHTALPAPRT